MGKAISKENNGKIIELVDVCKQFDGVSIVENINLYVRKGEFITFLGPSGCGKTTTLRMIAGFEVPTSGKILLNGEDISALPPHLRPVNTVFQKYALFPHLNVFENVAFGLKQKRIETTYVGATETPSNCLHTSTNSMILQLFSLEIALPIFIYSVIN